MEMMMNLVRTAMLLAFMTALFMVIGFMIGGRSGMMIAFVVAAGMNFFSYCNSDRLSCAGGGRAQCTGVLCHHSRSLAQCRPADAEGLPL
jgi:hypothetical protein